jgi:hypothetical protein
VSHSAASTEGHVEETMKIRIAILAACASTLVLAATTGAFAGGEVSPFLIVLGGKHATESKTPVVKKKGITGERSASQERKRGADHK